MRASLNQRPKNLFQNRFSLQKHFIVPKPHDAKPRARQIMRPLQILQHMLEMLTAVELDNESRSQADEIRDVPAELSLPTESITAESTVAQEIPETSFGVAGVQA